MDNGQLVPINIEPTNVSRINSPDGFMASLLLLDSVESMPGASEALVAEIMTKIEANATIPMSNIWINGFLSIKLL